MESKRVSETRFRVRYAETDASGVVYHANYLVWFEVGRGEFFWQQGRDYARDVEQRGVWLAGYRGVAALPGLGALRRHGGGACVGARIAEPQHHDRVRGA